VIAALLPGRTDDAVRNRYLRLLKKRNADGDGPALNPSGGITSQDLADCEAVKKGDMWTAEEDAAITDAVIRYGQKWQLISEHVPGRSANAVRNRFLRCNGISADGEASAGSGLRVRVSRMGAHQPVTATP